MSADPVTVAFQLLRDANVETLRHVVKFLCQPNRAPIGSTDNLSLERVAPLRIEEADTLERGFTSQRFMTSGAGKSRVGCARRRRVCSGASVSSPSRGKMQLNTAL
jgi:hypothetical protein